MWGPQRPKFWILAEDFGFWGFLDFGSWGFWILGILDFGDFGFWILGILDFGFWGRNPKSPIQDPKSKLFWPILGILDFGPLCSNSLCGPKFRGFWILGIWDFGFGGFWIWGFRILDFGDFGFWGFWILDFGPLCSKSLCEAPNAPNLGDFGFWGFWILGILDFGVWGFWILWQILDAT